MTAEETIAKAVGIMYPQWDEGRRSMFAEFVCEQLRAGGFEVFRPDECAEIWWCESHDSVCDGDQGICQAAEGALPPYDWPDDCDLSLRRLIPVGVTQP